MLYHLRVQALGISASAFSCRVGSAVVISRLVEAGNDWKLGLRFAAENFEFFRIIRNRSDSQQCLLMT
jgi:hypothetical protein